jgi:hypothetical protein
VPGNTNELERFHKTTAAKEASSSILGVIVLFCAADYSLHEREKTEQYEADDA